MQYGHGQLAFCLVFEESVHFGDGSVECEDLEFVVCGIQDQILAHDGQADEAEISPNKAPISIKDSDIPQLQDCILRKTMNVLFRLGQGRLL